jgi:hypothetical protein
VCLCVHLWVSLMRGNWIFIAFDDCHFSNKTLEEKKKENGILGL